MTMLSHILTWTNQNAGAIQALAAVCSLVTTVVLVLLTARYVALTKRLSDVSLRQLELYRAESSRAQGRLLVQGQLKVRFGPLASEVALSEFRATDLERHVTWSGQRHERQTLDLPLVNLGNAMSEVSVRVSYLTVEDTVKCSSTVHFGNWAAEKILELHVDTALLDWLRSRSVVRLEFFYTSSVGVEVLEVFTLYVDTYGRPVKDESMHLGELPPGARRLLLVRESVQEGPSSHIKLAAHNDA
jgi:hypothetical protein